MVKLFTYCIPSDNGAAPNPFWGVCTLVICKPVIRRVAQVGDWIVGTGSVNSPIGNASGKVVYAMQVSQKMTMEKYDEYVEDYIPLKYPDWSNDDVRRKLGDAIYDFSTKPPLIRKSVHDESYRDKDQRGHYALLSNLFFYFGDKPKKLPKELEPIVKQSPGHRSKSNDPYVEEFLNWLYGLGLEPNKLYGKPQKQLWKDEYDNWCSPC
jgi:hypothetical protein